MRNFLSVPCCLSKTDPLLHRNKIAKNDITKISFLHENQEFSSASFPHTFKAIRLLEKISEPKMLFFLLQKKCFFGGLLSNVLKWEKMTYFWLIFQTSILYAETKIFKKHIFTIYIFKLIWTFLVNIKFVCSMVILYISILSISPMLQTIQNPCLESKFYRKSSFSRKKDAFLIKNTVFYPL